MYNNPNRLRNIELPENLFSNLGEKKFKPNISSEEVSEYKENKLTNFSDKKKYRDRITKMYEDMEELTPIDNEIDNVLYFNNYIEKGIVVKPKISSLKQFWTEYRLIKNEKNNPQIKEHIDKERKEKKHKEIKTKELNNFDDLFKALQQRVTEINNYIDELKEMRTSIDISNSKLEEDREKLKREKQSFQDFKNKEEERINKEKETLKINYDRLQTIINDLDKKLNEIEK